MYAWIEYRKECLHAENVKLPPNMHSAWGMGTTQPDPAQNRTLDDGLIVPLGTPVQRKINSSLLYNEYPLLIYLLCLL